MATWSTVLFAFTAGLLQSVATAPAGVSGAVFLLPVQVSILEVPSPAVTPTNLLFNVVAGPGALPRCHKAGRLGGPPARLLIAGTVPVVVLGTVIRVFAVPGPRVFRLFIGVLLSPLAVLVHGAPGPYPPRSRPVLVPCHRRAGRSRRGHRGNLRDRRRLPARPDAGGPRSADSCGRACRSGLHLCHACCRRRRLRRAGHDHHGRHRSALASWSHGRAGRTGGRLPRRPPPAPAARNRTPSPARHSLSVSASATQSRH